MAIEKRTAQELVVKAGLELMESGLIARTWGNVSARISDNVFVITPSGIPYEKLIPDDIVEVTIDELEYDENGLKPSSEKGVHAAATSIIWKWTSSSTPIRSPLPRSASPAETSLSPMRKRSSERSSPTRSTACPPPAN